MRRDFTPRCRVLSRRLRNGVESACNVYILITRSVGPFYVANERDTRSTDTRSTPEGSVRTVPERGNKAD